MDGRHRCKRRRRSRCRASQVVPGTLGERSRWIAIAERSTGMYCREGRREREAQGSPIRTMRIGPPRPAPSLFGSFLGTAPQERRKQRSWPRRGGRQDARSHAKKEPARPQDETKLCACTQKKPKALDGFRAGWPRNDDEMGVDSGFSPVRYRCKRCLWQWPSCGIAPQRAHLRLQ